MAREYPPEIYDEILARYSFDTSKSLRQICDGDPERFPVFSTVWKKIFVNETLHAAYERASVMRAEAAADEALGIADHRTGDFDDDGKFVGESVQRAKLRVETRLKIAAALAPRYNPKSVLQTADGNGKRQALAQIAVPLKDRPGDDD